MAWTIKRLMDCLNIEEDKAREVLWVVKGIIDPMDYESVKTWVSRCYNPPSRVELKLEALNEIIDGYGTESIEGDYVDSYYMDIRYIYINKGDTYQGTIVFDTANSKFILSSWGDIVEKDSSLH